MRFLMSRAARLLIAAVVVMTAAEAGAADERAIIFNFTPTERAQIAIWIESADGMFRGTVGLTQAVSLHGIGNRPGATQMNSGYHWPYGRREGVLPIWAHRRLSAPGAVAFPRIIFQRRPEGYASRACEDSTRDTYFCLSFSADKAGRENLDAVTCASVFNSDKGRIMTATDVANGYTEPAAIGGQQTDRPLERTSAYPPRRDFVSCADASTVNVCMGGSSTCQDHPDSATFQDVARSVMPDIDAVTMATPPANVPQTVMFSVPSSWPDGEYVAYVEVNTEGDYNDIFNADVYKTPMSSDWDSWAMSYGYPYRGQPSVVYGVPFTLGQEQGLYSAMTPVGFGSVDGTDADPGAMHAMDGTITDDPIGAPGSGADRLRLASTLTSRLDVEVRPCPDNPPPGAPGDFTVEKVEDPKHSHEWARLRFNVPFTVGLGIARYEVRASKVDPIVPGDEISFLRGEPGESASLTADALMIPVGGAPGTPVEIDLGGLDAMTRYWIGLRAVDSCNRSGPHVVAEFTTTRINYTQLSGPCFIATAAWGSALEPTVSAMRHARNQLLAEVPLFAVAADLYTRSGPAAAGVLKRSETARVLARQMLGPLGTIAIAHDQQ